ncbi:type II secretion system protein G [Elusimicrobium posterum]|uniref:type IV pilin protein n=1 Tax=Elusimicrobium posterum TaxID=3116653 RepID=UPI003C7620ED
MKKGFTLIELLVVVLIIGILAAIALPQYTKAVEKSRSAEALIMVKSINDALDRLIMQNGSYPALNGKNLADAMDIDVPGGGKWMDGDQNEQDAGPYYKTKNFYYLFSCNVNSCRIGSISARDQKSSDGYTNPTFSLIIDKKASTGETTRRCGTNLTPTGRSICKGLEANGYTYDDSEWLL